MSAARIAELEALLPTAQTDVEYDGWAAELDELTNGNMASTNGDDGSHVDADPPVSRGDEPRNLTELGNAERLLDRRGDDLLYSPQLRGWHVWDGRRWRHDEQAALLWAQECARAIHQEAEHADDDELRKAIIRHANRSEQARSVRATLDLAGPMRTKAVDDFDADPFELTVRNGTLDLRTGKLLPHDRKRLSTRITDLSYDRAADCPAWRAFLARVLDHDDELLAFLQRAVGYSLTGSVDEQVLFLLHGSGSNGKTTFVETIRTLGGDYATQTPASTLLEQRQGSDAIPNDLARLRAVRLVTASETGDGRRLNEERMKAITGGDTISARFLHREWFDYRPAFKLWLSTNHLPRISGTEHAIWRRVRQIPFTVTIPDQEQDRDLPHKLRGELPGILAWAITGCLEWQDQGLGTARAVDEATAAYREQMDILGAFLAERCIIAPDALSKAAELYAAYKTWASESGIERPVTKQAFGRALTDRGFEQGRKQDARLWRGVGLPSGGLLEDADGGMTQ